jgi:hypothetical protein
MVHERQRLAFRLKARDDLPRVHPGLDDLKRYAAADRRLLFRRVNGTEAALADQLQ